MHFRKDTTKLLWENTSEVYFPSKIGEVSYLDGADTPSKAKSGHSTAVGERQCHVGTLWFNKYTTLTPQYNFRL